MCSGRTRIRTASKGSGWTSKVISTVHRSISSSWKCNCIKMERKVLGRVVGEFSSTPFEQKTPERGISCDSIQCPIQTFQSVQKCCYCSKALCLEHLPASLCICPLALRRPSQRASTWHTDNIRSSWHMTMQKPKDPTPSGAQRCDRKVVSGAATWNAKRNCEEGPRYVSSHTHWRSKKCALIVF